MALYNRNPTGRNQHQPAPGVDNPVFVQALQKYHSEHISSNEVIKDRLLAEHGILTSVSNIKRRRADLGLYGSRSKKGRLPEKQLEQVVLNQLDQDQARRRGLATTMASIAFTQGIHIPRDDVSRIMHLHDPDGFERRKPGAKQIRRNPVVPIGIHERWAGDGHDKLYRIGFPIWAVVDFATSKILGAWVVPSNRMGSTVAYLFLSLVEKYKGIPLEFSTDCGSETTQLFGYANSLREAFHSDVSTSELPAHRYVRSIHNIVCERGWFRMRLELGDNAVEAYENGVAEGMYDWQDSKQVDLCRWLWSKLMQQELNNYVESRNAFKGRKVTNKAGPSGISRNEAFLFPERHNLRNCLLPLNDEQLDVVRKVKIELGGDDLIAFVSKEYAAWAQAAYDGLGVTELTFKNVWQVFGALLAHI